MFPQSVQIEKDTNQALWYLGIDFGTTTISAVLLNRATGEKYQIYWWNDLKKVKPEFASMISGEAMFRLPTATYSGPGASKLFVETPVASVVVGSLASLLAKEAGIYLQNFKPYLKIGIPYYSKEHHEWEPSLQLPGQQSVSLYWVRWALQAILTTLTPGSILTDLPLKVGAVGLEAETLAAALGKLEGVVLSYPKSWGDTYQINLREAVIEAKLVQDIEQIFFLEDAIATILAALSKDNIVTYSKTLVSSSHKSKRASQLGLSVTNRDYSSEEPGVGASQLGLSVTNKDYSSEEPGVGASQLGLSVTNKDYSSEEPLLKTCGCTLAINCGATTTEMALVDVPNNLEYLTHRNFNLRSWAYGGNAIDQDIFWQLLYPQMTQEQLKDLSLSPDLEIPLPNKPEPKKRDRAASELQSSPFGQALLKACGYLKLILQRKSEFTLELGTNRWLVKRQDFESRAIVPFIEEINRELNELLVEGKVLGTEITRVICIGGSSNFPNMKKWLKQKLPNATLIQETDFPNGIAGGLASLALYPQVLNREEQQYSDYFVLLEILRAFSYTRGDASSRAYSIKEIMGLLERRGLNTTACCDRILSIIEGKLPSGLVPSIDYTNWLSEGSCQNPHYTQIAAAGLFSVCDVSEDGDALETSVTVEGERFYRVNLEQHEDLLQYLDILLSNTHQPFEEPLLCYLG